MPVPRDVLVTGAAGGLGRPLVERLAGEGSRVFAGIRRPEDTDKLPRSPNVVPVVFDVTDDDSVAAAAETIQRAVGDAGLAALVNNAGVMFHGPLELVSGSSLRTQFDVNVLGTMAVTRALLPALRGARGRIVNVTAVTARVTFPFAGPISASKTALESLSDALRVELKQFGVTVAVVEPGGLATEIFDKAGRSAERDLAAASPAVRERYVPAVQAVAEAFAKVTPGPVEIGVDTIVKALTDRKPATRYVAGHDARMIAMLRHLPDRLRDRVLLRNLGLRRLSEEVRDHARSR